MCHADWIIWMDASIRFTSNNLTTTRSTMHKTGGFAALTLAEHSIFSATEANMFTYLPMDAEKAKKTEMAQSGILSFARTRELYKDIIFWWVLCALQGDCMAIGNLECSFKNNDRWKYFADCNRYDQAALSIIAVNKYYNESVFVPEKPPIIVYRGAMEHEPIKNC